MEHIKALYEKWINANNKEDPIWVAHAARAYIADGFMVMPIEPNGKRPLTKNGLKDATSDEKMLNLWLTKWPNMNLAVVTGGPADLFVLDLDKKQDKDGEKNLNEYLEKMGEVMPETANSRSQSGGRHYFFRWFDGGRNTSEKIAPAIDTRGGTADKNQGYVLVWPSSIKGQFYQWVALTDIAPAPLWLERALNGVEAATLQRKHVEEDEILVRDIKKALAHISPDIEHDDWVKVGMAIYDRFPNDFGKRLWDEWSKGGDKYPHDNTIDNKWRSFARRDPLAPVVTLKTLFHMARENDPSLEFEHEKQHIDAEISPALGLIMEMNRLCFVNLGSTSSFEICIEKGDKLLRYSTGAARQLFENQKVEVPTKNGKVKMVNPIDLWIQSPLRRELDGITFRPSLSRVQCEEETNQYNLFDGWAYSPISHNYDISLYIDELIGNTICRGDEKLKTFVLDWLADIFQNPEDPPGTALVLVGEEGTGKGMFVAPLEKLLNKNRMFLKEAGSIKIAGRFNSFLQSALLVFLDEFDSVSGKKAKNALKSIITDRSVLIEPKGKDPYMADIFPRFIIASNYEDAVPVEGTSRRWVICDVDNRHKQDTEFFGMLARMYEDRRFLEELMYFFMSREITSNLKVALQTYALERAKVEQSKNHDAVLGWIKHVLEKGYDEFIEEMREEFGDLVPTDDLYQAFDLWKRENRIFEDVSKSKFSRKLTRFGFEIKFKKIAGKAVRAYAFPAKDELIKNLSHYMNIKPETVEELIV